MSAKDPIFHICDDWIHIRLSEKDAIRTAQNALSMDGQWSEIVPGMDSVAVQYDPARLLPDAALNMAKQQLADLAGTASASMPAITIPVCYEEEYALDRDFIASRLGAETSALPAWHSAQDYRVALLGFMPGFAYLENEKDSPAIGRMAEPRQCVPAGSIGIIGKQNCIYSFDSPGGWPIIGRTPLRLFDPGKQPPALLSAGQPLRFEPISSQVFAAMQQQAQS